MVTDKEKFRIFRLIPLIVFIAGVFLTVVGLTGSLKTFRAIGPLVLAFGGFSQLAIAFCWYSRRNLLPAQDTSTNVEQGNYAPEINANQSYTDECASELGSIHHFEIPVPPEPSAPEIMPPSYEEAVNDGYTENFQDSSVVTSDDQVSSMEETPNESLGEES